MPRTPVEVPTTPQAPPSPRPVPPPLPPERARIIVQPVRPVAPMTSPEPVQTIRREPEKNLIPFPESSNTSPKKPQESKKDFEKPVESKKDFEPVHAKPEIEFDRNGDVGRWRTDDQVKELVIYRYEWKEWPEDVPVETGLRSYYELRYFKEGMNRKGERYADLYGKHRAKRDFWIDEYTAGQATSQSQLDTSETKSNVVPLRRSGTSN